MYHSFFYMFWFLYLAYTTQFASKCILARYFIYYDQIYIIKIENTKLQYVVHLTAETKKKYTGFLVTLARENRTIGSIIGKIANTCPVTL